MGSPLSPILADRVMKILLITVVRQLDFPVPVLCKYVDDLLIALPCHKIQSTLDTFNAYSQHLQFTKEEEVDNKLPFLDTVVIRNQDQTLTTSWYSKPISSGRLLNFHSLHPLSMKVNVASNFIHRVTSLTTHQPLREQKQIIFNHLRLNNYPASLINRLLQQPRNNINNSIFSPHTLMLASNTQNIHQLPNINLSPNSTSIPSAIYRSLPYVPVLTSSLSSILKKDFPNIKIASKTLLTNSKILKNIKDPIHPLQQSKVIYSIPCRDCPMTYIGMTRNKLGERLSGHRYNVNKYRKIVEEGTTDAEEQKRKMGERTALIDHCIEHTHEFELDQIKVIDKSFKLSALPVLEMCHITNTANTVNHRTDVDGLSTTYSGILHTMKACNSRRSRLGGTPRMGTNTADLTIS